MDGKPLQHDEDTSAYPQAGRVYDMYSFQENCSIDPEQFTDIIGRNFKQPREGLGFDGSPTAHMWRTMIWPNNFL